MSLSVWLTTFSMKISVSIYLAANGITSFIFMAEQHSIVWIYHILECERKKIASHCKVNVDWIKVNVDEACSMGMSKTPPSLCNYCDYTSQGIHWKYWW